jgi:hypothetical protein
MKLKCDKCGKNFNKEIRLAMHKCDEDVEFNKIMMRDDIVVYGKEKYNMSFERLYDIFRIIITGDTFDAVSKLIHFMHFDTETNHCNVYINVNNTAKAMVKYRNDAESKVDNWRETTMKEITDSMQNEAIKLLGHFVRDNREIIMGKVMSLIIDKMDYIDRLSLIYEKLIEPNEKAKSSEESPPSSAPEKL